jgi:hypothetical protein
MHDDRALLVLNLPTKAIAAELDLVAAVCRLCCLD